MKKTTVILLSLIVCLSTVGFRMGETEGTASASVEVYYTHLAKIDEKQLEDLPEAIKESIKERLEKGRVFVLRSNGRNSVYTFKGDAQASENRGGNSISMINGHSNYFKDFENNEQIEQRFFRGETYLIKNEIGRFDWKIGSESVDIEGFSCRQATITYGNGKVTRAWFTEDIPIPDGPTFYHGLPGLILKVEMGSMEIAATTVRMLDSVEINKPTVGKEISKEEMNRITKEQMNQQDTDSPGGGVIRIRKTIKMN